MNAEQFMARVDQSAGPAGCWPWLGAIAPSGYGRVHSRWAHRLSYEFLVGPIPAGLDIDHLCRNRLCVNPAHLEPVTRLVNVRRGLLVALRDQLSPITRAGTPRRCWHGSRKDAA